MVIFFIRGFLKTFPCQERGSKEMLNQSLAELSILQDGRRLKDKKFHKQ